MLEVDPTLTPQNTHSSLPQTKCFLSASTLLHDSGPWEEPGEEPPHRRIGECGGKKKKKFTQKDPGDRTLDLVEHQLQIRSCDQNLM